jgi:glycosyltransferase involved in cell wall biosynthesis
MTDKIRVLAWSDSVLAPTGFGTVSRHVLAGLHATGRYRIDQLAINYFGEFFDFADYPYQISSARLLDPSDPFGNRQLIRSLERGDYDLLWILNDINVVQSVATELERVKNEKRVRGKKVFKTIFYYPVDNVVWPHVAGMIRSADAVVTYTEWAKQQTLAALPDLNKPVHVIPHGVDPDAFFPYPADLRFRARKEVLGIPDPNTFIVLNVNRNNPRKNLSQSILAFSELRKQAPNSHLHIHTNPIEGDIDLFQPCAYLGLRVPEDVSFPHSQILNNETGLSIEMLNALYNTADVFLTTTLGEGWSLTVSEAMAAGVPVVAPRHTALTEVLSTSQSHLAHPYECSEQTRVDNSGYRPLGLTSAIAKQLLACFENWQRRDPGVAKTDAIDIERTWESVIEQWIDVVQKLFK